MKLQSLHTPSLGDGGGGGGWAIFQNVHTGESLVKSEFWVGIGALAGGDIF